MPYSTVTSYSNPTLDSQTNLSGSKDIQPTSAQSPSDLMIRLNKEKKIARDFQSRKHTDWNETYDLYRNVNKTNRLTQRQAVNIPLMKETIKGLLAKTDDAPVVDWKELSGDEMKQLIFQEMWNEAFKTQNFEGVDLVDKKSVLMFGRGFRFLNWDKETVTVNPLDIYDIVVDPLVTPLDIETARFIIRQNIFKSLREILADDRYDNDAKKRLKVYLSTKDGIIQSESNRKELFKKQQRLKDMGILEDKFANFSAGDVLVNLSEHYTNSWDKSEKKFIRHVVVYADDKIEMMDKELKVLIGVDFWPFVTWGEDPETNDFWSDGPGDLVRVPNKILNVWFSQLVENRTLKNFQMHWYDATIEGYVPQTYEPGPGRMLPSPGNPKDKIMPVDISGLDDTMGAIDFLTRTVERGSGVTAIDKGQNLAKRRQTKAEIQALIAGANERVLAMAKFYRRAWYDLAMKWYKMMDANTTKKTTLYKVSKTGKIWPKIVYPSDWKSQAGYKPTVHSSSEQENEKTKSIQRFSFILQQFPNNPALKRVAQRRMLDIVDLTPEELREVEDAEKQTEQQIVQQEQGGVQLGQTQDQQLIQGVQRKLAQLGQV